ncbi:MAG: restriction endonuclease subunit S [Pseudomonadales bacterium]|nr:restriction endonuclease subunit S [Pseudomonadales bacterium]MBP7908573.1 restriction endonuclease subunit S [Pseudomonadales bacterium]
MSGKLKVQRDDADCIGAKVGLEAAARRLDQVHVAQLSDCTAPRIDQGGAPDAGEFTYIDIGSIDSEEKRIREPKILTVDAAPSRAKQRLKAGDVLVSMTRPNLNAVAIVPREYDGAVASTGFHVLRATEGTDPLWLYYAVQTQAFISTMCGLVQGALYPAVRPRDIRAFAIPHPPRNRQKLIVAEIEKQFSRLDEAVAGLKRVKANLKRYKAAVLKAAVEGRLVETEAELARREGRSYETGEKLLQRILETRRSQWQGKGKYKQPAAPDTTDLPELPEGWVWATVGQLACLVEYGSSAKTSDVSGGVPVLRMGNIVDGELRFDELKYLPANHDEFPKLYLNPGDLLFNRTNSPELVGKSAVYAGSAKECSFASYLIRVRLVDGAVPKLLAAYINSSHGRRWVKSVVTQQVGQANVNGTKLQALSVPLPPQGEQLRIASDVERRLSILRATEAQVDSNLQRVVRMRQSILGSLFLET